MRFFDYVRVGIKGNGVLDVVLFMPFALFFLFVVADGGLSLVQRAAYTDALRSGLLASASYVKTRHPISLNFNLEFEENDSEIEDLVRRGAQEIFHRISSESGNLPNASNRTFAVEASIVRIPLNTADGSIRSDANFQVIASASVPEAGVLSPEVQVEGYPYVSREEFIKEKIGEEVSKSPSGFAVPLGLVYRPGSRSARVPYLPFALLLYGEVRAVAQGINRTYSKSVLGRFYGVQRQELLSLRSQLE